MTFVREEPGHMKDFLFRAMFENWFSGFVLILICYGQTLPQEQTSLIRSGLSSFHDDKCSSKPENEKVNLISLGSDVEIDGIDTSASKLKRNTLGRSKELMADWHFSCPRLGAHRERKFKWRAVYNAIKQEVEYKEIENIEYFSDRDTTGWNPIEFKATYHHRVCIRVDADTQCFYHFWQHFSGQVYPGHMTMYAPTTMSPIEALWPGVFETCCPIGTTPTVNTPTSTCLIDYIIVSSPPTIRPPEF